MKLSWRSVPGLLHMFGGVILFQLALWRFGVKPAIAASLAYLVLDGIWRRARHERLPPIWLLSNGLVVVFGGVDLWAKTPFMLKYEAPISNTIVGLIFLAGAFGQRPLVLQFAEQSVGSAFDKNRPALIAYFRAFTLLWAGYAFAKAGVFLWLASAYPLGKAFALRSTIGTSSLVFMLAISVSGRRVFAFCQRLGLFRERASEQGQAYAAPALTRGAIQ